MIAAIVCLVSAMLGARDALRVSIDADVQQVRVLDEVAITVHATAPLGWEVQCGVEGLHAGDLIGDDDGVLQVEDVAKSSRGAGSDVEWTWRVRASGYTPGKARVGAWPLVARRIDGDETSAATTDPLEVTVTSLLGVGDESFEAGALRPGVVEEETGGNGWVIPVAIGAALVVVGVGAWIWRARRRHHPADEVARAFEGFRREIESTEATARLRALRAALAMAGVERAPAAVGGELGDLLRESPLEQDERGALLQAFGEEERAAYAGAQGASRPDLEPVLRDLERIAMRRATEART